MKGKVKKFYFDKKSTLPNFSKFINNALVHEYFLGLPIVFEKDS